MCVWILLAFKQLSSIPRLKSNKYNNVTTILCWKWCHMYAVHHFKSKHITVGPHTFACFHIRQKLCDIISLQLYNFTLRIQKDPFPLPPSCCHFTSCITSRLVSCVYWLTQRRQLCNLHVHDYCCCHIPTSLVVVISAAQQRDNDTHSYALPKKSW